MLNIKEGINLKLSPCKLLSNKLGQGALTATVLGGIVLSTIVASATSWYLSMRNQMGDVESRLESSTIAQSEWERLSHMSLDELESNRNTLKTPYRVGDYEVSVNLGTRGEFNNGKCGFVESGHVANCFNDTTITVYRDGNRLYTTRTMPLMAGNYTRKELDDKFASLNTKITNNANSITNLTNRLNGKEFVKNKTPNYDMNFRYEKKAGEDKASIHAYIGNTEVPLASQAGSGSGDNGTINASYTILPDGTIIQWGTILNISGNGSEQVTFPIPFKKYVSGITVTRITTLNNPEKYDIPVVDWDSLTLTKFITKYVGIRGDNNRISWIAIGR